MADSQDPLHERTRRLLSDYIFFCTRESDTPEPPPTSVKAALLRSVTRQIQQKGVHVALLCGEMVPITPENFRKRYTH